MAKRLSIKKGDSVLVVSGSSKGKTGKIMRTIPSSGRVIVEGINLRKRHVRPKKEGEKGQTVMVPSPIHASNVRMVCSACSRKTRVGHTLQDGKKVRVCKKCGHILE